MSRFFGLFGRFLSGGVPGVLGAVVGLGARALGRRLGLGQGTKSDEETEENPGEEGGSSKHKGAHYTMIARGPRRRAWIR